MASAPMPVARRYTFEQFMAIRRYQPTLSFSPDGSEVAYVTNTSGQFNLWRQSSGGGYPHQLTTFEDQSVRHVAWSPDGQTILFTADREGDEFHQVYRIPARGGWPEPLTDAPEAQHYLASVDAWSPDGRAVAYAGNDREPTEQDVLVRDLDLPEASRPLAGSGDYFVEAWAPDGTTLTVTNVISTTDTEVHLIDVAHGETRHLTPHDEEVLYFPGPWAADGSGFYLATDDGREFMGFAFFSIAAGTYEWRETPDQDVEAVAASADGQYLAWTVNEGGSSRLSVRYLPTGALVDLPDLPRGVIDALTLARTGSKLGFLLSRPDHPSEVHVLDLAEHTLTQITHGFLGGIDPADLIAPGDITFPSFDGRRIPALLYRPAGSGPFPAILSIHGGPEAQERPDYDGMYQYLLNRGIGILAPNVRGSTGYGKSYQRLIHRDWGGGDLKDFEAAVTYLHDLDWVDADRIGVYGRSYGGLATLSCISRLPHYWAAAVDVVGPSNLVTFAKAVPPTWRRLMAAWVGDPETEADFLLERSPVTYADAITAPLFVIQGANDPRVVKTESDQIVERLRARGVDVRYDVYEDEGHGFTKRENVLKAQRDTAEFFEHHLLSEA
jgi:dipeptidyl aminopeptidase/acylaminoacyl peptidase